MKLSAIIIAKNAEDYIADALASVNFCNEIIVIDSGSTDKTVAIAKKTGAKCFVYKTKNFADSRNYGLNKAKGDWVLYIDTDERVNDTLRENIKSQISRPKDDQPLAENITAFRIKRKNYYFGNHQWPYVEKLERLFLKKNIKGWHGVIHESPIIEGNIGDLDGFLLHYSHQDLSSMVTKTILWSKTEAELRIADNHPKMTWWRFFRVIITAFFDSFIRQQGWKAGATGIVECVYQAFSMFITYAKLWELQQEKENAQK